MTSILTSIKKLLGLAADYTHFDSDIVVHINTVLMRLAQMGVGKKGYLITNEMDTWEQFLGDTTKLESVKTYVYIKVKLIFDPPTNSALLEALKSTAAELEWCLTVEADTNTEKEG